MHNMPHTEAAKARMRLAHAGKPRPWRRSTEIRDGISHFRCGSCEGFFPRDLFHKSNRTSLGIKSDCKPCHSAAALATRNPELARGGAHHPTNLQPLCRACNERKQARTRDYRTDEQRRAVESVWVIDFERAEPAADPLQALHDNAQELGLYDEPKEAL